MIADNFGRAIESLILKKTKLKYQKRQ